MTDHAWIPMAAVEDRRLTAEARLLLITLLHHANGEKAQRSPEGLGYAWVSRKALARRLGASRSSIDRYIKALEATRWVLATLYAPRQPGHPSPYWRAGLLLVALEEPLSDEAYGSVRAVLDDEEKSYLEGLERARVSRRGDSIKPLCVKAVTHAMRQGCDACSVQAPAQPGPDYP